MEKMETTIVFKASGLGLSGFCETGLLGTPTRRIIEFWGWESTIWGCGCGPQRPVGKKNRMLLQ